jgi:hypothetical protein
LPIDYPVRFYLERQKSHIPMNGRPEPGEWVYVVGLPGLTVQEVLRKPPIELDDEHLDKARWTLVPVPSARTYSGNLSLVRTRYKVSLEQ